MFPLNYALAVALLTGPAEGAQKAPNAEECLTLQPSLQALAISWEVLDPREVRYVLARADEFGADLHVLRRRYDELLDAPPACDGLRFPDRSCINELISFNRAYRQHLDSRQALGTPFQWELHEALQETDQLYQVWDTVRDARCDYYYVTVRRQALKKLRDLVGFAAYYRAELPPHVPIWRFARID